MSETDANAAWQDRIFSQGVRIGLDRILGQIVARGEVRADQDPSRLADVCLTLLVPSAWRYLVVERGWTAAAFSSSRHALIDAVLASALPVKAPARRAANSRKPPAANGSNWPPV